MNRGFLCIILVMVSLGLCIPIGSSAMAVVPVWLFTFLTLVISSVVLLPAAKLYDKVKWTKLGVKNYYGIFMQSLLNCVLYTVFLLYGLKYSSVIAAGVINSLVPAVTLLLAFFLLRERFSIRKGFAILLAVTAVLIMEVVGVRGSGESNWLGNLFMILAVVSLAMFYVYAKKFSVVVPPVTMSAGLCVMGAIITLPMAIYEGFSFDWGSLTTSTWTIIVVYALLGWVLSYVFTYLGMPKIPASTVGMSTAIIPITATIYAVAFLGEPIRTVDAIALVLVIISIIIAESKEEEEPELAGEAPVSIDYSESEFVSDSK